MKLRKFFGLAAIGIFLIGIQPARADERADALLQQVAAKSRATRTLTADIVMTWKVPGHPVRKNTGSLKLMKPNYARIALVGDYPLQVLASDGTSVYTLPNASKYTKVKADPRGGNINSPWWGLPFRYFFTQSINPFGPRPDPTAKTHYLGAEKVAGQTFRAIEVSGTRPMAYTAKFYINAEDVIQLTVVDFGQKTRLAWFRAKLTNIHIGQPTSAADFHFAPPATARLVGQGPPDKMLSIGESAPGFTLPTPEGKEVSLASVVKGRRAVLINFWFLDCPPCREEFPQFQKLYEELQGKGFSIVAIDKGDSPADVAKYARQAGLTFPIVMGGKEGKGNVFDRYRQQAYPGSYLLNSQGRIVYRAEGVNTGGLREALKKLGLN